MLTFDHLGDPWWHNGQEDDRGVAVEPDRLFAQRVTDFSRWLRARPEVVVVVVGHGRTNAKGVKNAIGQAHKAVQGGIIEALQTGMARYKEADAADIVPSQ